MILDKIINHIRKRMEEDKIKNDSLQSLNQIETMLSRTMIAVGQTSFHTHLIEWFCNKLENTTVVDYEKAIDAIVFYCRVNGLQIPNKIFNFPQYKLMKEQEKLDDVKKDFE